jgi:hypothetical protein
LDDAEAPEIWIPSNCRVTFELVGVPTVMKSCVRGLTDPPLRTTVGTEVACGEWPAVIRRFLVIAIGDVGAIVFEIALGVRTIVLLESALLFAVVIAVLRLSVGPTTMIAALAVAVTASEATTAPSAPKATFQTVSRGAAVECFIEELLSRAWLSNR